MKQRTSPPTPSFLASLSVITPWFVEMIAVPSPPNTLGSSSLLAYTRRPGLEILLRPEITFSFLSVADILLNEGYIAKYDIVEDGSFKTIRITLKYGVDKNEKVISGLKRISKPGLRVYASSEELPRVLGGLGTAIISTNQGVITDKEARKLQIGGEVLCFIW